MEKNMTQEQLANECGVERTTICMIETCHNKPSVELAKKLGKVLDIDWTKFYEDQMLLTVAEVAKELRVNRNFVYKIIKDGELEAVKVGSIKVKKEALTKYVNDKIINERG